MNNRKKKEEMRETQHEIENYTELLCGESERFQLNIC